MKAIINESKKETQEFPRLLQHINIKGFIILAIKETKDNLFQGVVVADTRENPYKEGTCGDDWVKDYFEPFDGSVTISND